MITINKKDTTGSWAINGEPLYVPNAHTNIEHTSLASSESGRTEDGKMHITWIRRDMIKIKLKYTAMTGAELKWLLERVQGKEFELTYVDCGDVKTVSAYCSGCNYSFYTAALNPDGIYRDVSVNFIEI